MKICINHGLQLISFVALSYVCTMSEIKADESAKPIICRLKVKRSSRNEIRNGGLPCMRKIKKLMEPVGHALNTEISNLHDDSHQYPDYLHDRLLSENHRDLSHNCEPRCPGPVSPYCVYFWCGSRRFGYISYNISAITKRTSLSKVAEKELRKLAKLENRDLKCRKFLEDAKCFELE